MTSPQGFLLRKKSSLRSEWGFLMMFLLVQDIVPYYSFLVKIINQSFLIESNFIKKYKIIHKNNFIIIISIINLLYKFNLFIRDIIMMVILIITSSIKNRI